MSEKRPHIVIVGGGFAGANVTRLLQKRAKFADITLVSEESYTTFSPMLAEVIGATVFPEQVVAPLRATVGRGRFVMGFPARHHALPFHAQPRIARQRQGRGDAGVADAEIGGVRAMNSTLQLVIPAAFNSGAGQAGLAAGGSTDQAVRDRRPDRRADGVSCEQRVGIDDGTIIRSMAAGPRTGSKIFKLGLRGSKSNFADRAKDIY